MMRRACYASSLGIRKCWSRAARAAAWSVVFSASVLAQVSSPDTNYIEFDHVRMYYPPAKTIFRDCAPSIRLFDNVSLDEDQFEKLKTIVDKINTDSDPGCEYRLGLGKWNGNIPLIHGKRALYIYGMGPCDQGGCESYTFFSTEFPSQTSLILSIRMIERR
jgi:hypothetical protein